MSKSVTVSKSNKAVKVDKTISKSQINNQINNQTNKQMNSQVINQIHNDPTLPWIEKYRPAKLVSIKIDNHIKTQVEKMIKSKDVPNIILEGPPGVGKTSTIKCIARDIYRRYYKDMVLEMNASDERGIKIQDPIEAFRKAYVHIDEQDKDSIPCFKMVILDEADNMTDKAKHIISGFIKNCVSDLRFAFTCNSKDNIIPSIQSGCHIVKYPPLTDGIVRGKLFDICTAEGIITKTTDKKQLTMIEEGIRCISQITNGDLRFAINILQLTYNRFGLIGKNYVYNIQDKPHPEKSKDIMVCCMNGDLGDAIKKVSDLRLCGYSGTDIALGLRLALRLDICDDFPEHIKIAFWKCISYSSYNISKGLDSSLLQVTACVADMFLSAQKLKIQNS